MPISGRNYYYYNIIIIIIITIIATNLLKGFLPWQVTAYQYAEGLGLLGHLPQTLGNRLVKKMLTR